MDNDFLYIQISDTFRRAILNGEYKPGASFPPIRSIAKKWKCTIGTVQRGFQILASEGLVTTHIGRGTKVLAPVSIDASDILRKANIIHQVENFLLMMLAKGFSIEDIEGSFQIASDRWRAISQNNRNSETRILRFSGSHDLLVAWLATHFSELFPGHRMSVSFSGSLTGLKSLAEGRSDIAGVHLWDEITDSYNLPFVQRVIPGEKMAIVNLTQRSIGWILEKGNPKGFSRLEDLARDDIRFVNRNTGSGTRVFFDAMVKKHGMKSSVITGYLNQKNTHSEIAATIFEKKADVGLGMEAAARAYDLDFIFLQLEQYDLVMRSTVFDDVATQNLLTWLKTEEFRSRANMFQGYDCSDSGTITWSQDV